MLTIALMSSSSAVASYTARSGNTLDGKPLAPRGTSRAWVPGRSEPYTVQWDVCQKGLRLVLGPKPIGSRRMSCFGFRAMVVSHERPIAAIAWSNRPQRESRCRQRVLELIQHLLNSVF